jgi:hypothetical protein
MTQKDITIALIQYTLSIVTLTAMTKVSLLAIINSKLIYFCRNIVIRKLIETKLIEYASSLQLWANLNLSNVSQSRSCKHLTSNEMLSMIFLMTILLCRTDWRTNRNGVLQCHRMIYYINAETPTTHLYRAQSQWQHSVGNPAGSEGHPTG